MVTPARPQSERSTPRSPSTQPDGSNGGESGSHLTRRWRRQSRANPSLQRPNHCKLKRQSGNFPRTSIFCARKSSGSAADRPILVFYSRLYARTRARSANEFALLDGSPRRVM